MDKAKNYNESIIEGNKILYHQLQLLAEKSASQQSTLHELAQCTLAMCEVYKLLFVVADEK